MAILPPPVFNAAKKRMRLGLHPAVLAAVESSIAHRAGEPSPGARQQAYLGSAVNPGHARPVPAGGDMRAAADPLANQQYESYLQKDPEGGLREVHVYGTGQNRQVRAFTPKTVAPSALQQLSNTATAHDKLLAMAVRQAALGNLPAGGVGEQRKFSRSPGILKRY